jgi:hypothetical protein
MRVPRINSTIARGCQEKAKGLNFLAVRRGNLRPDAP